MRSQRDAVTVEIRQPRKVPTCLAFGSSSVSCSPHVTKRTKSEKSQRKADELEKRLDDRPKENEKKPTEREQPDRADIDSIRH
jgi:hypothetical protein